MAFQQWQGNDLLLELAVQPRARRNGIAGVHDGRLKVQLTAAPTDGKANIQLRRWLAEQFGTPLKQVEILRGQHSRHKRVMIKSPLKLPEMILDKH